MGTADEIRDSQRNTWDEYSSGWEKWDEFVQRSNGPAGAAIVDCLDIAGNQQHLDVASGTGEPGLTMAELAPEGSVVLTDLSSGMLEAARRFADARGLSNVEFEVASADELPFANETFDSVSCRFGFMFFPNLDKAAAEMARVLRPGGTVATVVWAGPDANPWASLPTRAITSEVEMPAPDPTGPGMFRCSEPGFISHLFQRAGLTDVREHDLTLELIADDAEAYWEMVTELTAPVVAVLSQIDAATRSRIDEKVLTALRPYESDGKLRLRGTARCISGSKAPSTSS